jgi:non-specific serine/threonine protein kinase
MDRPDSSAELAGAIDAIATATLTAQAAAAELNVHHRTIRRAIARGDLPAVKYAGTYRIAPDDLARYRARLAQPVLRVPVDRVVAGAAPAPGPAPTRRSPVGAVQPPPTPLTTLVGRDREAASVAALLRRPDRPDGARLLSLIGPGGIGKTRLAIRVAGQLRDAFADGVAYVALSPIRDPALVASAIADVLGLRQADRRPAPERVQHTLRSRRCLLVLDNFEQVLPAASLVSDLLAACPNLTLLVTSRAPLNLSGEHRFPVPPLALPDPVGWLSFDRVAASDAVRLFVERAQSVRSDFTLTETNAPVVAEICARLDSIPLAIELAATRIGLLAPRALLTRLERRLPLLTGGPVDAPVRLRTMRDAIAWSYDLLAADEQVLFRRLAVFVGGFTLEAAEAVASSFALRASRSGSGVAHTVLDEECRDVGRSKLEARGAKLATLEGIASLLDHSLLRPEHSADGTISDEAETDSPRFVLLETVREYALDLLAGSGELETSRDAHAAYYVTLAERAEAAFWGEGPGDWHALLTGELPNFRAARDRLAERGATAETLRLAAALEPLWWIVGGPGEGLGWLEESLALASDVAAETRVRALVVAGRLLVARGEYPRAISLAQDARRLSLRHGDRLGLARATEVLGLATQFSGDGDGARALLEEAVALYRELAEPARLGRALGQLGTLGDLGTLDRAGDPADQDGAARCCDEALALFRALGDRAGLAWALNVRACLAYKRRAYRQAETLAREALALRWTLHDIWEIPASFDDLADIAGMTGRPERAAWLYGASEALRTAIEKTISPYYLEEYEREVAVTRGQLTPEAFAAAWATGFALPIEEAVARALAGDPPTSGDPPGAVLTPREREVLRLLTTGAGNHEIAGALFLTHATVKRHLANIYAKLDVHSRAGAVSYAHRHGLAPTDPSPR